MLLLGTIFHGGVIPVWMLQGSTVVCVGVKRTVCVFIKECVIEQQCGAVRTFLSPTTE